MGKPKTHKSTAKRMKFTATGKVKKRRQYRNSRFSRNSNSKDTNTDKKNRILAPVETKKVEKLLTKK